MANETVAQRYDRDWLELQDDRKIRTFDHQTSERRNRTYADPTTLVTASSTGDNDNGFTVTINPA